jgi:hypothetical protein
MTRHPRAAVAAALLASAIAPATASAAKAPKTGAYAGITSQLVNNVQQTITFNVGSHGKRFGNGRVQYSAPCTSEPGTAVTGGLTLKGAIDKHRRFSSTGGFSTDLGNGRTGQVVADFAGRFINTHSAKGTLAVSVLVYDANHNRVDTCNSHTVKFTAQHK